MGVRTVVTVGLTTVYLAGSLIGLSFVLTLWSPFH